MCYTGTGMVYVVFGVFLCCEDFLQQLNRQSGPKTQSGAEECFGFLMKNNLGCCVTSSQCWQLI